MVFETTAAGRGYCTRLGVWRVVFIEKWVRLAARQGGNGRLFGRVSPHGEDRPVGHVSGKGNLLMQKGIVVALMAMLTGALFVQPLCGQTDSNLTVDGVTYTNAVFGTVTPYAVTVKHSTGVASVPLDRLPADLRERFGYDRPKAQDYLQESTARQSALLAGDRQESVARSGREHEAAVKADVANTE